MKTFEQYLTETEIKYDTDHFKSMPKKTSEYSIDNNIIWVNPAKKDEFENFWKYHELGHAEFGEQLKKQYGNKASVELDKIRDEGYPWNDEERHAFKKQFCHLKGKMSREQIMKILEKEYADSNGFDDNMRLFFESLLDKYL